MPGGGRVGGGRATNHYELKKEAKTQERKKIVPIIHSATFASLLQRLSGRKCQNGMCESNMGQHFFHANVTAAVCCCPLLARTVEWMMHVSLCMLACAFLRCMHASPLCSCLNVLFRISGSRSVY